MLSLAPSHVPATGGNFGRLWPCQIKATAAWKSRLKPTRENLFQIGLFFDAEMSDEYIPLSQRSAALQLRAEAGQYRRMAATAPADIRDSLLRLAARVEALADRREAGGGGSQLG
jgi:hypothetical protein